MKVITVTNIKLHIPEDKTIILERDNPYLHVRSQVRYEIENFIKEHLEYDYTVEEVDE